MWHAGGDGLGPWLIGPGIGRRRPLSRLVQEEVGHGDEVADPRQDLLEGGTGVPSEQGGKHLAHLALLREPGGAREVIDIVGQRSRKVTATTARLGLAVSTASSTFCSSSPLMARAWRRIQKIIHVSTPAAASDR